MAQNISNLGSSPYNMTGFGNIGKPSTRQPPRMIGVPGTQGTALALQIRSQKGFGK